jgi:hypothetical protein
MQSRNTAVCNPAVFSRWHCPESTVCHGSRKFFISKAIKCTWLDIVSRCPVWRLPRRQKSKAVAETRTGDHIFDYDQVTIATPGRTTTTFLRFKKLFERPLLSGARCELWRAALTRMSIITFN